MRYYNLVLRRYKGASWQYYSCQWTLYVSPIHERSYFDHQTLINWPDDRISFAICPSGHLILAQETWKGEDTLGFSTWSRAVRLWPQPERESNALIPDIVRISLEEANRCHRAAAYTASAGMCGRALEGICNHFQTKDRYLGKGLQELLDRNIIDQRLFDWSEQLRRHRNLAAHATGKRISRVDATDLLDFLNAICEYVFVLTPRFQAFMERQTKQTTPSGNKGDDTK